MYIQGQFCKTMNLNDLLHYEWELFTVNKLYGGFLYANNLLMDYCRISPLQDDRSMNMMATAFDVLFR